MSKESVKREIASKRAYVAAKREEIKLWRARKSGSKDKTYKAHCDGQIRLKQSDVANRMGEIARLRERLKYEK